MDDQNNQGGMGQGGDQNQPASPGGGPQQPADQGGTQTPQTPSPSQGWETPASPGQETPAGGDQGGTQTPQGQGDEGQNPSDTGGGAPGM